jgi:hypothetical protein
VLTPIWILTLTAQALPGSTATASTAVDRAAAAAERAAEAAQKAADAAARIAAAVEREHPSPKTATATLAAVPAPPAAPPPSGTWAVTLGVGLISLQGNSNTLTLSGNASVERKTEDWIYAGKASGAFGQGQLSGQTDSSVLALNGSLQLRGDRRFTPRYSGYLMAGADADHVKSLEFRGYAEGGIGILWVDDKEGDLQKALFRTDVAIRGGKEFRFQYYPSAMDLPDLTIATPRFGVALRYALTKDVGLYQDAEVMPSVAGDSRVLFDSLSKISAHITKELALGVSWQLNFDSTPAPGKKTTDSALTLGLDVVL